MRIRTSNHTYQNVYNSGVGWSTADNGFNNWELIILFLQIWMQMMNNTCLGYVEGHVSASPGGTTSINTGGSTGFSCQVSLTVNQTKEIITYLKGDKMANHTKTVTLTDVQQQILSNDLYNDTDNKGLDDLDTEVQ